MQRFTALSAISLVSATALLAAPARADHCDGRDALWEAADELDEAAEDLRD